VTLFQLDAIKFSLEVEPKNLNVSNSLKTVEFE